MTKQEIKTTLNNYLIDENNTTLKKTFCELDKYFIYSNSELLEAVYQCFDISIQDIQSDSDYYYIASYYFDEIGYSVELDGNFNISNNVNRFIDSLFYVIDAKDKLKIKLQRLK